MSHSRETQKLQVRDLEATGGQKRFGFLDIAETPTGPVKIPIALINGVEPGPTLCITAGVHAAEYSGIDAVMRTIQALEPASLRGAVIAVPVVNTPMFDQRSGFTSPIDGLNLNRTAPGKPDGSVSEILAHVIVREVLTKAEYHIDCHGGDLGEVLLPYTGFAMSGDVDFDSKGEEIARIYSPSIVALYRDGSELPRTAGSITGAAAELGVVSILAEAGSDGYLKSKDSDIHCSGIRRVMTHLGMLEGDPPIHRAPTEAKTQFIIYSPRGGLVRFLVDVGNSVEEGQEVAEIVDLFGNNVESVTTPKTGIVRLIWKQNHAANTGDPLIRCWVV